MRNAGGRAPYLTNASSLTEADVKYGDRMLFGAFMIAGDFNSHRQECDAILKDLSCLGHIHARLLALYHGKYARVVLAIVLFLLLHLEIVRVIVAGV